jgi:hypothetical protein
MKRYDYKLKEISSARNNSATASKTRGLKWTKNQLSRMRLIAADINAPTLMLLKSIFPTMSQYKLEAMLEKIKFFRKKFADELNIDDVDGIRNSNGSGYIYLIENKAYDGWIKCGMTTKISSRLNSYNVNDPLKSFNLLIEKKVSNRRLAEKLLINELASSSVLCNGEWFKIKKDKAIEIFNTI